MGATNSSTVTFPITSTVVLISAGGPVAPRPPLPVLPRFRSDPEDYKLLFVDNTMFANLTGKFKRRVFIFGRSIISSDRALLLSGCAFP